MKSIYVEWISERLGLKSWQVENCAGMFEEGSSIPFISRYRKEKTGGMDDASVAEVKHWVDDSPRWRSARKPFLRPSRLRGL